MAFRILCGIDGQEPSIKGTRAAFDLAVQSGAELSICMVNPIVPGRAVITRWPQEHINRVLDEAVCHAKWAGVLKVKSETWNAIDVAESIISYADAHNVDLIVAGVSDRSSMIRALRGSVARELIARANCPVLMVRRLREDAAPIRPQQDEEVQLLRAVNLHPRDERPRRQFLFCKDLS
ncbi:universal stress protein [Dongia deserti]|uniref:universal stress protein n=1 Tax=Dongia deserti TaxID=2268030 RepID=UPI000E65437E|nr:universal stress protein [Dongia deserti]